MTRQRRCSSCCGQREYPGNSKQTAQPASGLWKLCTTEATFCFSRPQNLLKYVGSCCNFLGPAVALFHRLKMSSEVLMWSPHCPCSAVAQGLPVKDPAVQLDGPLPPSATAGFRSAKYLPEEWFSNYHAVLQQAGTDRRVAGSIQRDSKALYQDTEAVTLNTQDDGTRRLGERLQEVYCWKSELKQHIQHLLTDTDTLLALKLRLEKALDATETAHAIATDNLTCRSRRLIPDLVQDGVEEELVKETDLIRNVQFLLKRTLDEVICQIRKNRAAKHTLESDWSDKQEGYDFDVQGGRYSNLSTDTQMHPSSAAMQHHVCNPTSWTTFTQDNLSKALQEEHATNTLRLLVQRVLQDTTHDLTTQCASVDRAFTQRCAELIEAKTLLEIKLAQVLEQIGAQERNIVALQQAIYNKEAPMRVVQSRLYLRSLRPNMELCRDEPQYSLEGELKQIDATLASLRQQLNESKSSLAHLEESRMILEKDINCKAHSLFIEREKCMAHRKRYPTVSTLSGY